MLKFLPIFAYKNSESLMPISVRQLLTNSRLMAVLFMGFASGLPLALTSSTLQAWFTEANVNLTMIGTLSLVGIPYSLKFLWAPILDHYRLPILGRRQDWVLVSQLGLALSLFILANLNPQSNAVSMGVVALLVAFLSATQDIAIDAYRTDILHVNERGLGASYTVFAYRIAALISGGFALICADYLGWKLTYEIMAVSVLLCAIPTIRSPQVNIVATSSNHFYQTINLAIRDLLQRDNIYLLLLFIALYKIGDAFALQLFTNFLLHGLDFTLTEVGLAYKVVSFLATILGAFVGGLFLVRWNIYRALLIFGFAQAISNLMFVLLAIVGKNFSLMTLSIFIENFCSGLSTAALFTFLMSLCNTRYTASQFAFLSAVASLGRVFLGPLAAFIVQRYGYVSYFSWAFAISFPGLAILFLLRNQVGFAHATE